jgi:hypothetical protein
VQGACDAITEAFDQRHEALGRQSTLLQTKYLGFEANALHGSYDSGTVLV